MHEPIDRLIASNVRLLRKKKGLRQVDLVEALARAGHAIPLTALSKLERGDRSVSAADLIALSYALDVAVGDLIQSNTCPTCGQALPPKSLG